MRSTFSVLFYINRSRIKADGTTAIICRITIDGKNTVITTGIYCKPEDWNIKNGTVRTVREKLRLQEYRKYIEQIYVIMFRNIWGTAGGLAELRSGAAIPIGRHIAFLINWVTPGIMLAIFIAWLYQNLFEQQNPHIDNILQGKAGAIFPLVWVLLVTLFFCFIARTSRRFKHGENLETKYDREPFS